jgi:hypothetical protein
LNDDDMDILHKLNRITLTLLAGGVLMTNGCALPHAEIRATSLGQVAPLNYCPGDTIAATYSLLNATGEACVSRAGMDCSTIAPTLTMSSSPTAFPTQSFNTLTGGLTFVPTEPRIDVSFALPSSPALVMYPIVDMAGVPKFASQWFSNKTHTVQRIDGEINQALTHNGMCAGSTPVHAPAQIATTPMYSPNLRLRTVCNTNAVPITVTLSGPAGELSRDLAPGACFGLDEPGVPIEFNTSNVIAARPQAIDPMQCRALEGSAPPQTLTTRVSLACGM